MKRYSELRREYDALDEKYSRILGEKSELAYELEELKAAAEHIREQDREIRNLHENVRRMKHDMKNHLMVIASYFNSGDYDEAKAYISRILDKLNAMYSYIETGNSLMNHILTEKLNAARDKGISVKAEVETLFFGRMESIDFSALLSNLLDNAIEACGPEETPEIVVTIARRRDYETMLVKNKISHSVLESNPKLHSSKAEQGSHGMGILQIRSITEKYAGMCDFYEEDGYFCACAFIPV